MRLQLIVQRHSLPPVQVLWTVGVLRPPYAAAGTSALVSQLLEQINEIIPLESGDWGLEDYAVEVRGFECLHFSELSQVLKEDDEVRIRPLQTSDLRFRKVSGRHQISADGKHLIDGIAFGRPYLRRPDRPTIRIPPRKRRRVTYDDDDDNDSVEIFDDRQLVLRRGTNDFDRSLDIDEEDDEDFSPDEDKENDLSTELQDIYNDVLDDSAGDMLTERTTNLDGVEEPSRRLTRSQSAKRGLGLQGAAMLELVDENGRPYPEEYNNPLLDLFSKDEVHHNTTKHKRIKEKLNHRRKSKAAVQVCQEETERVSRRSSSASMKSVRFEDPNSNTPATIRDFETMNRINHQGFEPAIDIAIDPDESDKENSQPHFEAYLPGASPSITTSSSSSSSSEHEYDDEETSSFGSSSADSSSESESERHPTASSVLPVQSDRSSQTGSSSMNTDSEAEKPAESSNGTGFAVTKDSTIATATWKNSEAGTQTNERQVQGSSLPFEGKNRTRKRNQRRRDSKKMKILKMTGMLPENATLSDFHRLKENEHIVDMVSEELEEEMQVDTDFELRRDALLEAITSDGLEVSRDLELEDVSATANIVETSTNCHAAVTEDSQKQLVNDQSNNMQEVGQTANRKSAQDAALTDQVSLGSSQRRSKLDIASSRRLLFGSLGLPTPKNKQDEIKIRDQLMKDIKRRRLSDSQNETEADLPFAKGEPVENERWEEKIVLKAVECCYDGIELSTPPFPFVQRWDPQQQGGHEGLNGRNARRSKKRKRNDEQFYEQVPVHNLEDGKTNANVVAPVNEDNQDNDRVPLESKQQLQKQQAITSRIENDEYELAINDQLKRETNASASASAGDGTTQDLPMLPQDMSTCTPLTKGISLRGAIVAFKQLDMSQETNWEPRVSDYRTALVDHLMENGILRMTLARRDQPQVQKSYNQQTGERIYSKFEMPGFNDDESLENGIVELSFAELIEPKLIRAASVELLVTEEQQSWGHGAGHPIEVIETDSIETNIVHSDMPSPKLPNRSITGSKPDSGREEVRKEINDLIKDAGWRSSIHSDIGHDRGPGHHLSPNDQAGHREQELLDPISPKFSGFSSSPAAGRRIEARSELSPQIEKVFEVAESLPFQRISRPELSPKDMSGYEDEVLDVKEEDGDEHPAGNEPRPKSGLPETDHQVLSQQCGSSKSPYQSLSSNTSDLQHNPPTKEVISTQDSDSDSDEFPLVEDIFSQMRSSYEPSSVEVDDSTYMGNSSFETSISKDEPISGSEVLKVKPDGKENLPRASQVPLQSQIVDLTLSSDPADAADSDYVDYGTQLPSGPGWVQKRKASGHRFNSVEASNRRSRRTRSTSQRAFS